MIPLLATGVMPSAVPYMLATDQIESSVLAFAAKPN